MTNRTFRPFLLVFALASLTSCGDILGPRGERGELERNRDRWRANAYAGYSFTVTRLCFCGPDLTQPARVVVRGDSVVSVTAVSDGRVLDPRYFPTVEDLFEFIADAIDERAVLLRVVYDPVFGYPLEIDYDLSQMIADEETQFRTSALVRQ